MSTPAESTVRDAEPKAKPASTLSSSRAKPVATLASKPKTEEGDTAEQNGDTCQRRALWIGVSVAAVAVAVGIPLIVKACSGGGEEEEEEKEKKVASSGAVLNKLVSWVKELRDGDKEEEPVEEEKKETKYVEISSVVDFAKTQSM